MSSDDIAWLCVGLNFLGVELYGVFNGHRGDTASEWLRLIFGYASKGHMVRRVSWIVALILLALHIAGVPYLSMHS